MVNDFVLEIDTRRQKQAAPAKHDVHVYQWRLSIKFSADIMSFGR